MLGTWNFACTFPVWRSTNLVDGFWKFCFFGILWAKNCQKMAAILDFCRFLPIKWPKSKIFKIHQPDLWNVTQGRYMQNFRFLACMVSKWMYLLCFRDIAIWSSRAYSNYPRTQIFKKSYLGLRIIFFDAVFCLLLYSMRSLKITKHDFWPLDPPCGLK